jgi:hypothetical protein
MLILECIISHKPSHETTIVRETIFYENRTKIILRRFVIPFFAIYACLAIVAAIRDMSINSDEYAAVLLSDYAFWQYDYWASPCASLGSYIPWTHYFNNRNMKVKWFLRAKSNDLEKVIKDKDCQSIVLVGHGDIDSWQATDKEVSNSVVKTMMKNVPKKRGEWLQLSCGGDSKYFMSMSELVMDAKKNVYIYSTSVTTYYFIFDALSGFKYLKSLSK